MRTSTDKAPGTAKQKEKQKRNDKIASMFLKLRKKYPDVSLERIFAVIAEDYPITTAAIRNVCKDRGLC